MSGEVNISIKVADLKGEYKNIGRAADSSGNGVIDSAYEHSLFTQYCNNAGLEVDNFDADYTAKDTEKSQKALVKKQDYDGSTKDNVDLLNQIEANWQGAMSTAFKMVGNNPQMRATLMEVVKDKPKMKNFSDMAAYQAEMGKYIEKLGTAAGVDLAQFIGANTAAVIATQHATTNAIIQNDNTNADMIMQNDNDNTGAVIQNVNGNAGAIVDVVKQEGESTRQAVYDATAGVHYHLDDIENREIARDVRQSWQITDEASETRDAVREASNDVISNDNANAKETQELDASAKRITTNLNANVTTAHNVGTLDTMGKIQETIIQSDLPHTKKLEFMDKLEKLSIKVIIDDDEMVAVYKEVQNAIRNQ